MSKWISVKDRMPEPFKDVLVCIDWSRIRKEKRIVTVSYYLGDDEGYFFEEDTDGRVTHWMPLPELPEPPEGNV